MENCTKANSVHINERLIAEEEQKIFLMGHLVAGYPDREGWEAACRGMAAGGVDFLELQVPFSDPTADGPLNTTAGEAALQSGFSIGDLPWYLERAAEGAFREVHIMTYANIVYRYGIERFVADMERAGVTGLIVPDLPIEDEEGFFAAAAGRKIDPLPVAVVNMIPERLELLRSMRLRRCYVSLRQGVTGTRTDLGQDTVAFLDSLGIPLLYAGFGISGREQVEALQGHAYAAVVGSYFTATIMKAAGEEPQACRRNKLIFQRVREAAEALVPGKSDVGVSASL